MNFELIPFRKIDEFRISGEYHGCNRLTSYVERAAKELYSLLGQKIGSFSCIDYNLVETHVMDRLYNTLSFTTGIARAFDDQNYPDEEAVKRITRNIPEVAMKHWERVLARVMDASQMQ